MRERLVKLGIPILIFTTILVGCPLPFEFSGEGAGETERDPASPDVTAPVSIAYSESGGASGTLAAGGTHISGVDTTITLSTETPNAVIYYTTSGGLTDLNAATQINASSGNFVIPRTASLESRTITAIAVGPNMRPSPEVAATVSVSPFPILTIVGTPAAISEDGGTGNFVISSNIAPTSDLAVSVTTDGDYSNAEVDFSGVAPAGWTGPLPGITETITFPSGQTSISIPVTGKPTTANTSVTIGITIDPATGNDYSLTTQTRGQIVVADNNMPILSLSVVGSTTIDDATPNNTTIFRVSSTVAPTSDVTVSLQTSGDYQAGQVSGIPDANNPLSVTLLAGQQTVDIPIAVTGDANGDIVSETVTLTLQNDAQYVVETTSGAQTVTIADTSQIPVLSMGGADVTIDDNGMASATITVNTTVNPEVGLTVPLTFVGSLSTTPPVVATFETGDFSIDTDSAVAPTGSDTYDLTFNANESSAFVTLVGIPDSNDAENETVIITIGSYTGSGYGWTVDATNANRVITLTDPDHAITYNGNSSDGGAVPTDTTGYPVGSTVTVAGNPNNLSRSGFAFGGWNTLADGTGTTYNDPHDPTSPSTFAIGPADVTLYARWLTVPAAPSLNLAATEVVIFSTGARVNPHPTFDLTSSDLTAADGLVFRLAIGAAPTTGATKAADEIEITVASGNTDSGQFPQGQLALDSGITVYAIQRGTNTGWSNATFINFTTDDYSWANRATPTTLAGFNAALADNSVDYIDMRELGATTFTLTTTVPIPSTAQKNIVGDNLTFDGTNGLNSVRIFNVAPGALVTLDGLTLKNGVAQGEHGNNANGGGGGGGAAGFGGAIFIGDGAQVEISNVTFSDNKARGGDGGSAGGGASPGANGGGPHGGNGGALYQSGGSGGEFSGGGGGGGYDGSNPFPPIPGGIGGPRAGDGGSGGYGGGGGGGGSVSGGATAAAGAGGGSLAYGGPGESASFTQAGGGGGGAALGGAIFLDTNAVLRIHSGVAFTSNSADGGSGGASAVGPAGDGQGIGGAIFGRFGSFVIIMDSANPPSYSGNLADLGVDLYREPSAP